MNRVKTPFRHVDNEGNVLKVVKDTETQKLYIANTDTELKMGQYTHVRNIQKDPKGKVTIHAQDRGDSYQRWYDEASHDGSLAYNGSADDF